LGSYTAFVLAYILKTQQEALARNSRRSNWNVDDAEEVVQRWKVVVEIIRRTGAKVCAPVFLCMYV
jgi:hypothetical protein